MLDLLGDRSDHGVLPVDLWEPALVMVGEATSAWPTNLYVRWSHWCHSWASESFELPVLSSAAPIALVRPSIEI